MLTNSLLCVETMLKTEDAQIKIFWHYIYGALSSVGEKAKGQSNYDATLKVCNEYIFEL